MLLPSNALQDTKSKEIQDYSNAPKKKRKNSARCSMNGVASHDYAAAAALFFVLR